MTKERRSLIEAVKPEKTVPRTLEEQFVYEGSPKTNPATSPAPAMEVQPAKGRGAQISRVPFTTRVRTDFAAALKRASLERQLSGDFPNSLQDILEDALEPWLRTHGYLQ